MWRVPLAVAMLMTMMFGMRARSTYHGFGQRMHGVCVTLPRRALLDARVVWRVLLAMVVPVAAMVVPVAAMVVPVAAMVVPVAAMVVPVGRFGMMMLAPKVPQPFCGGLWEVVVRLIVPFPHFLIRRNNLLALLLVR